MVADAEEVGLPVVNMFKESVYLQFRDQDLREVYDKVEF